jgi:hydrogenase-1 operon protein HyaE
MILPSANCEALLSRLARCGYTRVDAGQFDRFSAATPLLLLMLNEDPRKYPEVADNAVIVPEALRTFPADTFTVAYADVENSRQLARRFGVVKFPALLCLRQGGYIGTIAGVRDWAELLRTLADMLTAPVKSPPSVGVAVLAAGGCA